MGPSRRPQDPRPPGAGRERFEHRPDARPLVPIAADSGGWPGGGTPARPVHPAWSSVDRGRLAAVSSLWTPGGEHRVPRSADAEPQDQAAAQGPDAGADEGESLDEAALRAE